MKLLTVLGSLASIVALTCTIKVWPADLPLRFVCIFAIVASIAFTIICWRHLRLRQTVVPILIHLKGVCAISHELHMVAYQLDHQSFQVKSVKGLLEHMSVRAKSRVMEMAGERHGLVEKSKALTTALIANDLEIFRRACECLRDAVHEEDRDALVRENLEGLVYPGVRSVGFEGAS